MKLISIVIPCYNEEENVVELYERLVKVFKEKSSYSYEIIFIDNASTDSTVQRLKSLASNDSNLKIIINNRNYGHIRSPYWALMQAKGDAVINMVSDLQDPPELIPQFISEWEKGCPIVLAIKPTSKTGFISHNIRRLFYWILDGISDVGIVRDATGFGIYDHTVIDQIRNISDPYPYLRGLICELGFPIKTIAFNQPRRGRGVSKNNFYTLYDMGMLAMISHSMVPIRLASITGFIIAAACFIMGTIYLILKLLFWNSFPLGTAPVIIGFLFLFGILFVFIGLLGEYIGSIHAFVRNRPIVVERERVNFD
jgi:dolichol-phosphate mannosyltransferase